MQMSVEQRMKTKNGGFCQQPKRVEHEQRPHVHRLALGRRRRVRQREAVDAQEQRADRRRG